MNAMLKDIREHMDVVAQDGSHVGTVDRVEGDRIKLTRKESGDGKHHYLPASCIASVEENQVRLSVSKDAAESSARAAD